MNHLAMLVIPAVLLAAAATTAPMPGRRASEPDRTPSSAHMDRHIDAHVPAREGDARADQEPTRRRPAQDPFRGVVQPPISTVPSAVQPPRDRRY